MFVASPYAYLGLVPEVLRIPRAQRMTHVQPKTFQAAMKKLPQKWRDAEADFDLFNDAMKACDATVGPHASPADQRQTMRIFLNGCNNMVTTH